MEKCKVCSELGSRVQILWHNAKGYEDVLLEDILCRRCAVRLSEKLPDILDEMVDELEADDAKG